MNWSTLYLSESLFDVDVFFLSSGSADELDADIGDGPG